MKSKQFTTPSSISPFYNHIKRLPRKFKKKWNKELSLDFLTIEQKRWYILNIENPEYSQFLINRIVGVI